MEPRNYLANATANPPAKPTGPSNGYPQTATPGVNPATSPGPHWFYKIGEGLRSLISGSGQTPSDDDLAQVLKGIKRFSGGNVTILTATATLTLDQAGLVLADASAGNIILTLPSAADLAALEYKIVRIDGSANTVTLAADGAEAVGGAATLTVFIDGARIVKSDGVNEFHLVTPILHTKFIDIGDWDMDAVGFISLAHGIVSGHTRIRTVQASIRSDAGTAVFDFFNRSSSLTEATNHQIDWNDNFLSLARASSGFFDTTNFDTATGFNRGWITIQYTD